MINIVQIEGSTLCKYDFMDYLKKKYPIIKKKYLMIKIEAITLQNTLLDTVFMNMIQVASFAGYQYIMIML